MASPSRTGSDSNVGPALAPRLARRLDDPLSEQLRQIAQRFGLGPTRRLDALVIPGRAAPVIGRHVPRALALLLEPERAGRGPAGRERVVNLVPGGLELGIGHLGIMAR